MNTVQPIREARQIEAMKRELKRSGYRDYMIFVLGIYSGLRISDILKLKVSDILDKTHLTITEQKTGKVKRLKIQLKLLEELSEYIQGMAQDDYLFQSQKGINKPVGRVQVYNILNKAAKAVGITENVGTHTMRKTFGYWFYQRQEKKDLAVLQYIFNHSSPSITLRYIGINDDMIDKAMEEFDYD